MQHVPTPTGTKEEVKDTRTRRTTIKMEVFPGNNLSQKLREVN